MEFRWNPDRNYRKLYYFQTSDTENDRSDWYLTLREEDRKIVMSKLTVTVPDFFDAKLKPERMSFCRTSRGGITGRSRCLEEIRATIEVTKDQTSIEVLPNQPVPTEGDYSLHIRLFNPRGKRMYQMNALIQAPGNMSIPSYVGSWIIDID
ncbi:DUF2808 domain-containing protein [Synechococcus sp. M16CYN]